MSNDTLHRRRFDELINRPLLREDADQLASLSQRLGIPIEWQHINLLDSRWTDGRYQHGDELPAPADDDPISVESWPQQNKLAEVSA